LAQEWAIAEARARDSQVHLVCAYDAGMHVTDGLLYPPQYGISLEQVRQDSERTVQQALDAARQQAGDTLVISGSVVEGNAVEVLLRQSKNASQLVVGSRELSATGAFLLGSVGLGVVADAVRPTVVTRGTSGLPAEDARVVVGLDGSAQSELVLDYAFDAASFRQLPLHAVLCWSSSVLSSARWLSGPAERAREEAEAWLAQCLAGWQERYPDVRVSSAALEDHPVPALVGESIAQHLLVVGNHRRRPVAGMLLGSVAQGLLHHAMCPVALVPLPGRDDR
jgi:nucleotide-binding universal stress UspA family protein